MRLLLFDIDGTLIRSSGAGRETLKVALTNLFGTAGPVDTYRMSGKTDQRIVTDLLTAAGIPEADIKPRLSKIYEQMAMAAYDIFPHKHVVPCVGVPQLLEALNARADVVLGLLTGNSEPTAPLKLLAADIDPSQFVAGAYGSDSSDRNRLPAIAMRRAGQLMDCTFIGSQTSIIGDTPADIRCARAGLANAVAVASGWHSSETLEQYSPDYLLDDFSDTAATIAALLGEGKPQN